MNVVKPVLLCLCFWIGLCVHGKKRPNIIVILADDMGYSDIGAYGSEVQTPVLDRLAIQGMRFAQFYNAARCCPTRASLLTGLYPQQSGVGGMTDIAVPIPEYQGYLNEHSVTLGEVLRSGGYSTYLSGKWHVGMRPQHWPVARGFNRSYSLIEGAASFFDFLPYRSELWPPGNEVILVEDDQQINGPDEDFYATDLYTDQAIRFIEEHDMRRPFFLYLAYTTPHWPMHALPEDIAKYETTYQVGYEVIREQRLERLKVEGLVSSDTQLPRMDEGVTPWEELTEEKRKEEAKVMSVYAAMIDRMDQNIGRLIEVLQSNDYAENTLVMFLSDNGGARAGNMVGGKYTHPRFSPEAEVGSPLSFGGYGRAWANVSNTPFREFKSDIHEGGISTPFIAWMPGKIPAGEVSTEVAHVVDVMPTLCELAGVEYPLWFNDYTIHPPQGRSLLSVLEGKSTLEGRPLYFEHLGKRGLIEGRWKLVAKREQPWELYDIQKDRQESNNLINTRIDVSASMIRKFEAWAFRNRVLPYDEVEALSPYEF